MWIDEVIQTSPGIDTSGYQIQVEPAGPSSNPSRLLGLSLVHNIVVVLVAERVVQVVGDIWVQMSLVARSRMEGWAFDVHRRKERGWSVGRDECGIAKPNHDKCRGSCLLALGGWAVSWME